MPLTSQISVSDVNRLSDAQFDNIFGNVIELYGSATKTVKLSRPFNDVMEICDAFRGFLDKLSIEEKLVILRLHPDLAGRLADQGALTAESMIEQKAAGLHTLTLADKKTIEESNRRYKEKFGFPFIICARENKVQSIIAGLRIRYENTREEEINIGIGEVKKICRLRILDIVNTDS